MTPRRAPVLPNPTSSADPNWQQFTRYLAQNSIVGQRGAAITAYQNASSGKYVCAETLNHCLTVLHYGASSDYAELARDQCGDLNDYEYEDSLQEIDEIFRNEAIQFGVGSVVYKGIGHAPYYQIIDFCKLKPGDKIKIHGFTSTTVCREKAESFVRGSRRILLKITGLENVLAIVPENRTVLSAPTPTIPEQEVLLNRGTTFEVTSNAIDPSGFRIIEVVAHKT